MAMELHTLYVEVEDDVVRSVHAPPPLARRLAFAAPGATTPPRTCTRKGWSITQWPKEDGAPRAPTPGDPSPVAPATPAVIHVDVSGGRVVDVHVPPALAGQVQVVVRDHDVEDDDAHVIEPV